MSIPCMEVKGSESLTGRDAIILDKFNRLLEIHDEIEDQKSMEKEIKSDVSKMSSEKRGYQARKKHYYGKEIIIDALNDKIGRIEHRMTKGALDPSEESKLINLFGSKTHQLFEEGEAITGISDLNKFLKDMIANGADLNEVFDKKNLIKSIKDEKKAMVSDEVQTVKAIVPKENILSVLNDPDTALSTEARDYINRYLNAALEPRIFVLKK